MGAGKKPSMKTPSCDESLAPKQKKASQGKNKREQDSNKDQYDISVECGQGSQLVKVTIKSSSSKKMKFKK